MPMATPRRLFALPLAFALVLASPGLGFYQALAGQVLGPRGGGKSWTAYIGGFASPASIPFAGHVPLDLTSGRSLQTFIRVMERTGLSPEALALVSPVEQAGLIETAVSGHAAALLQLELPAREETLLLVKGQLEDLGVVAALVPKVQRGPLEDRLGRVRGRLDEVKAGKVHALVESVERRWREKPGEDLRIVARDSSFGGTGLDKHQVQPKTEKTVPTPRLQQASGKTGLGALLDSFTAFLGGWKKRTAPQFSPEAPRAVSIEPLADEEPDAFLHPEHGLDLGLYVALIQHVRDQTPELAESTRRRYLSALRESPESVARLMKTIAAERKAAGFPFEPARLETTLKRQTGSAQQAVVELVNNGFDAMGDAIGRFGVGVYQAIGWLEEDGESLSYRGVSAEEPGRAYWVRFHRAQGRLWVQLGSEALAEPAVPGTEVVLSKNTAIDAAGLRRYLALKLGLSRRGRVLDGGALLNDLSAYRTLDGGKVRYRLSRGSVRLELGREGKELRVRDAGKGLAPEVVAEALPVPSVSTNKSNVELSRALSEGQATGEELFYRVGPATAKGRVVFLVGGTEVETLAVAGEALASELVLDLPAGASQKEARTQLVLDEATVAALKRLIDKAAAGFQRDPVRLAPVLNALAAALALLQESHRVKSLRKEDDLFLHLRERLKPALAALQEKGFVAVPAAVALGPEALGGRKPLALDARLWDFDPATVGGEVLPGTGKSVWTLPLKAVFARVGKRLLLLDEKSVLQQRAAALAGRAPVLLNLILGVWLGYGDRPPPEALLAAKPAKRATASKAATADEKTVRRLLAARKDLSPDRKDFLEPLLLRSLSGGETAETLALKLARVAAVYGAAPGLPADAVEAVFRTVVVLLERDGYFQDYDGAKVVLHRASADGAEPVAGLGAQKWMGKFARVGARLFFFARGDAPNSYTVYELGPQGARPVPGLAGKGDGHAIETVGGRSFVTMQEPDGTWTVYELGAEGATPVPGLAGKKEARFFTPKGGRVYARVQEPDSRWTAYEITAEGAAPLPGLDHVAILEFGQDGDGAFFRFLKHRVGGSPLSPEDLGKSYVSTGELEASHAAEEAARGLSFADTDRLLDELLKGLEIARAKGVEERSEKRDGVFKLAGREFVKTRVWIGPVYHGAGLYEAVDGGLRPIRDLSEQRILSEPFAVGKRIFVKAVSQSRETALYEIVAGRAEPVLILAGVQRVGEPFFAGDRAYLEVRFDESPLDWIYELGPDKISILPGLDGGSYARLLTGADGELLVSIQGGRGAKTTVLQNLVSPLKHVRAAPLSAEGVEFPSGLSEEERFRLARNLLRVDWPAERLKELGWALAFAELRALDRLEPAVRDSVVKDLGALVEERRREALSFVDGAATALVETAAFNRAVSRWLLIFSADPARALELARALKGRYELLGAETPGSALLEFLRGRTNLEPLAQKKGADVPGKVLGPVISNVPLSALAGIRANSKLIGEKGRDLRVADLEGVLPADGFPQTEKALERASGAEAGYDWLREGVQNGLKAAAQLGTSSKVDITAAIEELPGKTRLVASVRDRGAGMDLHDILHDLLPLDRSSFSQGQDAALGFYGRGWYKFLVRSDRVRVLSGKRGAGRHVALEAFKRDGRWMVASLQELEGEFEGTRVDWMRESPGGLAENRLAMELEAALIGDSLQTYVGVLASKDAAVTYNGRVVGETVTELGAVAWSGAEAVRVIETSSKKRRVLQKGLFVMDLEQDPELWALVPEELMGFLREQGLSLELPSGAAGQPHSIVLDRDRSGLAEKERVLGRLQKAILAAVSRAAARAVAEGRWKPKGLPVDYAYRSAHLWVDPGETGPLALALSGEAWPGVDPSALTRALGQDQSGAKLAHFLAAVEFDWKGRRLSLSRLRQEALAEARLKQPKADKEDLPTGFAALKSEALGRYRHVAAGTADDDVWEYEKPGKLSEREKRSRALLSALVAGFMDPLTRKRLGGAKKTYKLSFGRTKAPRLGIFGKDWLSLNVGGSRVKGWLSWVEKAAAGRTDAQEDYDNLFSLVETVVHEDAHAWELNTEETHNEAFQERMRATLLELAGLGVVPEDLLKRLRKAG